MTNSYRDVDFTFSRPSELNSKPPLQQVHELTGHKNRNWPIKSSFYSGAEYRGEDSWQEAADGDESNNGDDHASHNKLLATGSADGFAYVFDVSNESSRESSAPLLQKLGRHGERVYAVDFHPTLPVLATASADSTLKIWASGGRSARQVK